MDSLRPHRPLTPNVINQMRQLYAQTLTVCCDPPLSRALRSRTLWTVECVHPHRQSPLLPRHATTVQAAFDGHDMPTACEQYQLSDTTRTLTHRPSQRPNASSRHASIHHSFIRIGDIRAFHPIISRGNPPFLLSFPLPPLSLFFPPFPSPLLSLPLPSPRALPPKPARGSGGAL